MLHHQNNLYLHSEDKPIVLKKMPDQPTRNEPETKGDVWQDVDLYEDITDSGSC